jgi:hypothetical protein
MTTRAESTAQRTHTWGNHRFYVFGARVVEASKLLRWNDARGESRTRTRLPSADFESAASAIPPLGPDE